MPSTKAPPSNSKLFQPLQVGDIGLLGHRIVMAPLTRYRANSAHVHTDDLAFPYYTQRASVPGTLIVSEGTFIAPRAGGFANVPGIWSDEQCAAWKKITDSVHSKGSFIVIQLWAIGRAADPSQLVSEDPSFKDAYVSSGDVQLTGQPIPPRPLTVSEIKEYVDWYAKAADNAVKKAGFDGVEVHGAHGYLVDQFLQDRTNNRTDEYGGSIENRSRFGLEVIEAVTNVVGQGRVGIRLSPWSTFQEMRMEDPKPQFSHFVTRIQERFPDFGFIHVVEPRVAGNIDRIPSDGESNDFLRDIWGSKPYIAAGGFSAEDAVKVAEDKGGLVAFGRHFISNPDLPFRVRKGIPFTTYNRSTFYVVGSTTGYLDYPFSEEFEKELNGHGNGVGEGAHMLVKTRNFLRKLIR